MPSETNRLGALLRIDQRRLEDAIAMGRRMHLDFVSRAWPKLPDMRGIDKAGMKRLLAQSRAHPSHPANWHRRAREKALAEPRVGAMYFQMRRALWSWPEFLRLTNNARRILEVIIELACDEAFPWYVNVQAREIQKLVGLTHASMANRLKELECFAITREARRMSFYTRDPRSLMASLHEWPTEHNNWGIRKDVESEAIPQWIVKYRRGIPGNANRAAWWINYDLLYGTGRVLPCFIVELGTLPKTYESRNKFMGRRYSARSGNPGEPGKPGEDRFKRMSRFLSQKGPSPRPGLRAALWEGFGEASET